MAARALRPRGIAARTERAPCRVPLRPLHPENAATRFPPCDRRRRIAEPRRCTWRAREPGHPTRSRHHSLPNRGLLLCRKAQVRSGPILPLVNSRPDRGKRDRSRMAQGCPRPAVPAVCVSRAGAFGERESSGGCARSHTVSGGFEPRSPAGRAPVKRPPRESGGGRSVFGAEVPRMRVPELLAGPQSASVVSQRSGAWIGEPSWPLARRDDEGVSGRYVEEEQRSQRPRGPSRQELEPGVHARFISLPDLRAMKRAADRPLDRLDLEALARLHPEDEA